MKSGVYSTWTESIWQTLSVRMFLKPAAATERFSLILGSLVAGFSFVLVWLINNRADVLFNSRFVFMFPRNIEVNYIARACCTLTTFSGEPLIARDTLRTTY